ncbi:DgaE family pyridoxal phosphate-dependent ammonia lyase [Brochothrix campestris]|uniref:L-seryl-tRNA selenium transferase family protein n=1 Tax=Brochothrix campestris FSL F6-1037 TaxID=1265861 RepID=W7CZC0_9LIST|nr:DgaE family pyridoxal phosphate-dependent ammonia lyase [Brochothrix campestris]EUJ42120.1 L-seryl-tRNA selenium transferase family protein [Brochothrix campestris FSL F6-1037]
MTATNSYDTYGLKEVINASGKMTILGVSKVADEVLAAQQFGGTHFFEMSDLVVKTGRYIASLLNVPAALVVASASAGIAQSVAGVIGQGSQLHAYHPNTTTVSQREIILPKGHNVDYGTPVEVMVELGGGRVVEAGYANMCSAEHLAMMITPATAAILYIKSHHTVQKSMLSVAEAAAVAQAHQLPLIVDAAAEEDLQTYYEQGANLVIYSGGKAIEGPTSGLVIGDADLIAWVRLQNKGIGRAMKVGKENILGLTRAIEVYQTNGSETGTSMQARLAPFIVNLNAINHVSAKSVQDGAGRDIYRAEVTISEPASAIAVIAGLKAGKTAIYTREYRANIGIIEFDIRAVTAVEMEQIVARLTELLH